MVKNYSLKYWIISRLVIIALVGAAVFGINSIFFFVEQKKLSATANLIEDANALLGTAKLDKSIFTNELKKERQRCAEIIPIQCEEFVKQIIELKARNDDYLAVLIKTFGERDDSITINQLIKLDNIIHQLTKESFGMSFDIAKQKKIRTAKDYILYLKTNPEIYDSPKFNLLSTELLEKVEITYDAIITFAKTQPKNNLMKQKKLADNLFFTLIIFELTVFIIVSGMDIWNNLSDKKNLKEEFQLNLIIKKRTQPFIIIIFMQFSFSMAIIIMSQIVLSLESKSVINAHCQKLNLQNIFLYNQISTNSVQKIFNVFSNSFKLPNYCQEILPRHEKKELAKLLQTDVNAVETGELMRFYADSYSTIETIDSDLLKNLILCIIVSNVIVLSLEALKIKTEGKNLSFHK